MKIATFNANSIRARLHIILPWLAKHSPDVLCVQETKVADDSFPAGPVRDAGYHAAFCGEKAYNGVAIFSREAPDEVRRGFDGGGRDEGSRIIAARFGALTVVNTYVPQGADPESPKFRYKLEWLERLRGYFVENFSPGDRLLWLGDFNAAPAPEDVHDPEGLYGHVCYHPDVHAALEKIRGWGFADVFRKHTTAAGQYTFFDYRVRGALANGIGWRIDHIWATRSLADASTGAWIDLEPRMMEKPSDHTFLAAEFPL
ncbi:MAG: exodeoxyribonuclease III [Spirochaetes bacterium]|nr:exodeoxyribonuclease III [Spirochaetota bacterium]